MSRTLYKLKNQRQAEMFSSAKCVQIMEGNRNTFVDSEGILGREHWEFRLLNLSGVLSLCASFIKGEEEFLALLVTSRSKTAHCNSTRCTLPALEHVSSYGSP